MSGVLLARMACCDVLSTGAAGAIAWGDARREQALATLSASRAGRETVFIRLR
jgi:hypothetical protein